MSLSFLLLAPSLYLPQPFFILFHLSSLVYLFLLFFADINPTIENKLHISSLHLSINLGQYFLCALRYLNFKPESVGKFLPSGTSARLFNIFEISATIAHLA